MKKLKFDILGGTFTNLHITNKKSNIASIVEEMDKKESHDIKLITSSPKDEYMRLRHLKKKLKNIGKTISLTNNLMSKKMSLPLIERKNKSKKLRANLLLAGKKEENKNNIKKNKNKKESLYDRLCKKQIFIKIKDSNFSENKNKNKDIDKKEEYLPSYQDKKTKKISVFDSPSKLKFNNLDNNQAKTINNVKTIKRNKLIKQEINKKDTNEKYFQTGNLFLKTNPFIRNNNKKKTTNLLKTKSETEVKKIPRLKISENYLTEIENKLNTVYKTNKLDLIEKDKLLSEFKKKYENIYNKKKQTHNEDIARMEKEINENLLSLNFQDFYAYLLTILKNYDKRIVDWKFEANKDKKECPPELRFKSVKIKHKKFMGKLNKIYDFGMKANKFMDDLLFNTKKKEMILNYNKKINEENGFIHDLINKQPIHDDFIEKIFENKKNQYQNKLINNDI